ncbi:MocR-like pyridoxine biosynthesis transcription factor PdxR [Sphingopyxis fribergensis]
MTTSPLRPLPPLDPAAAEPFYRQIYDRVRGAIAHAVLKPGDRIPSARALAVELGLARGTVEAAYALLAAEGYILARGQAGTIISPELDPRALVGPVPHRVPTQVAQSFRPDSILPFQMGLPALDAFPRKIWARLGARCARAIQPATMAHPPASGSSALRTEIASYLRLSRGIACSPSQIFVTSGYRQSLQLIAQALFKAGDAIWVENPGFPPTRDLLGHMDLKPVPIPVDADGIDVAEALRLAPHARAAVVTPAHQSPLCLSLSLPRRMALLDWASQGGGWIIEDDYDGEYRYVSRPLPALKSLDRDGRVLYAGTFSKVLFPGLRLAYLVVPEAEVERFDAIMHAFAGGSPELVQAIVAAFIKEGHFARHIQRMRKLYAERRRFAVASLEAILADHLRVDAQPGGMHLVLRLRERRSDRALAARMLENGLYAEALSDWTVSGGHDPALLVNFTNIDSRATADRLAHEILRLI